MRKLLALLATTTALTIAFDAVAEDEAPPAEEKPTIQMGKITEFNGTWEKAAAIDTRLGEMHKGVMAAHEQTKLAAGVATDAPIEKAFEDMKATAGDKLVVAIEAGKAPKLSAADDAPENVKTFAVEADKAVAALSAVKDDALKLKDESIELGKEAAAIPASITPELIKNAGIKKPKEIKAEKDLQASNVEIVKGFPTQADSVISAATEFVTLVQSLAN